MRQPVPTRAHPVGSIALFLEAHPQVVVMVLDRTERQHAEEVCRAAGRHVRFVEDPEDPRLVRGILGRASR